MDTIPLWLAPVFFAIAFFYASVGLGGGSSYLAVLALIGLSHQVVPQTALVCNLIVSAGGVWHFSRGGHFDPRRVLPFVVLSVPAAYLGGRVAVEQRTFVILLGATLLVAAARMLLPSDRFRSMRSLTAARAWTIGLPVGALLGFLAGMVGIGGGIFLAPVLLLAGLANAKETAAATSLFVLANSAAGLAGQVTKGLYLDAMIIPLALAVLLGGQIGSRMGSYRIPVAGVRRLIATVIAAISLRLIWGAI